METMEDILQDDLVCLLCLQVPNEWFTIESCGCRFCQQVGFNLFKVLQWKLNVITIHILVHGDVCSL